MDGRRRINFYETKKMNKDNNSEEKGKSKINSESSKDYNFSQKNKPNPIVISDELTKNEEIDIPITLSIPLSSNESNENNKSEIKIGQEPKNQDLKNETLFSDSQNTPLVPKTQHSEPHVPTTDNTIEHEFITESKFISEDDPICDTSTGGHEMIEECKRDSDVICQFESTGITMPTNDQIDSNFQRELDANESLENSIIEQETIIEQEIITNDTIFQNEYLTTDQNIQPESIESSVDETMYELEISMNQSFTRTNESSIEHVLLRDETKTESISADEPIDQPMSRNGSVSSLSTFTENEQNYISQCQNLTLISEPEEKSQKSSNLVGSLFYGLKLADPYDIMGILTNESSIDLAYNNYFDPVLPDLKSFDGSVDNLPFITMPQDIYKIIIKPGDGPVLSTGNMVIGDFDFCDAQGNQNFEGSSFCCAAGNNHLETVVKDLISSMSVGEVALFVTPLPLFLIMNSDLENESERIDIILRIRISLMLAESVLDLTEEHVNFIGNIRNESTRSLYNSKNFISARKSYIDAIHFIDACSPEFANVPSVVNLHLKLLNNLASCEMALSKFTSAISISDLIITRSPQNYKAIRRKAIALYKLSDYTEAIYTIQKTLGWIDLENLNDAEKTLTFLRSKRQQAQAEDMEFFKKVSSGFSTKSQIPEIDSSAEAVVESNCSSDWIWPVVTTGLIVGVVAAFVWYRISR